MPADMVRVYVGIGSNLEDPEQQVRWAIDKLANIEGCKLQTVSSLYRSPPMGPAEQPDYVNAVAGLDCALQPERLLLDLKGIEQVQGRKPSARWGPRIIDLDILVFGDIELDEPRLVIPHPGIAQRVFVLIPLYEIAPGLSIPGFGNVDALVSGLESKGLEKIGHA